MCRDYLSTHIRLQDKGVQCSTNCVSCNSNHEDLTHIIFECPFAMQVWQMTGIWSEVNYVFLVTNSGIDVIFSLLQNLSHEHAQRLEVIF